jgi:hypothetical protein
MGNVFEKLTIYLQFYRDSLEGEDQLKKYGRG